MSDEPFGDGYQIVVELTVYDTEETCLKKCFSSTSSSRGEGGCVGQKQMALWMSLEPTSKMLLLKMKVQINIAAVRSGGDNCSSLCCGQV